MKAQDWLSERMVFGLLIIGGYLGALLAVTFKTDIGDSAQNLISTGMGVLGTAIGAIVAAIWKTDKVERQAAETAAVLAAKAPDHSGTGSGGPPPGSVTLTPPVDLEVRTPPAEKP